MKQALSIGKITKKTYCSNCFSILSWNSPEIEKNGVLKCPTCGSLVNYSNATIDFSNQIEKENIAIVVNGIAYDENNLEEGLRDIGRHGGEISMNKDIALTNTLVIEKDATINLNNSTLNCGNSTLFINNGKVTINGGEEGKITSQATTAIEVNDGILTINGGDIETTQWGVDVKGAGKIIFNNGTITSQEGCITPWNYSSVIINGGTLASKDNYVIGTNGRSTETGKTKYITINGGTLIGRKPVTAGYISCGIYSSNTGKVVLNGGKILSEAGCGILMRAGSVECNGTLIETKGNEEGWIGDSKQKVNCAGIVYDSLSNYPDKKTLKLKIGRNTEIKAENKKDIELYLAEGDQANIIDDRRQ